MCPSVFVISLLFFFFNKPATTEFNTYGHTLPLHDAFPIYAIRAFYCPGPEHHGLHPLVDEPPHEPGLQGLRAGQLRAGNARTVQGRSRQSCPPLHARSEEHTSELQSLMRISYAVFCLKNKKNTQDITPSQHKQPTHR